MRIKQNLVVIDEPKSPRSEEYRILRTNIEFSLVDKEKKVIMITSSMPSEGKSTTASNLAATLQQLGKKVVVVDCDQRKPVVHKKFSLSNSQGLSDYLVKNEDIKSVIQNTSIEGLDILTAGTIPPNPSELLSSKKMEHCISKLEEIYDYVILDTPPMGLVTDAQILSKYVDGVLLVVASNQVERNTIVKTKKILEEIEANVIGVVLNKVKINTKDEYYYAYEDENREQESKVSFKLPGRSLKRSTGRSSRKRRRR